METVFLSLTKSDFQDLMAETMTACLRRTLQNPDPQPCEKSSDYLTISETCKRMGGISKVTLNQYTKTGRIKAYRIGGRVLYKPADIEAAMTAVKTKSGGLKK